MRRLFRVLRWIVIVLVVIVLVASGGGYLWLRGALPQTSGTIRVKGPTAPIEIVRDADAVPHIRAGNETDALFGLGYVHAQDRLWQMEFQRRVGNGRLSEILGEATVPPDRFLRTLGTARAARSAWEKLGPEPRHLIEAYVAGVNAFIETHHGRQLPVEFTILGFEPEPWRPEDVLVWGKMMAWDLGGNWRQELLRTNLATALGDDKAAQLMPAYTADGPLILPDGITTARTETPVQAGLPSDPIPGASQSSTLATGLPGDPIPGASQSSTLTAGLPSDPIPGASQFDDLLAINRFLEDSLGLGGNHIGSNNWVIGGARTTTGKPLLANDPHLGASIPSIWYLAHISGGAFDAIGATLPGIPGIIIGHNQRIAWGVTNTGPDVQDLFTERINDRNEAEYKGAWEPVQIVQEVIKVKDRPDVTLQVRITRHGPVISDIDPTATEPAAFRWPSLDDEDRTIEAFLGVNRAGTWDEFTGALASYHAPMQNFVYADIDGNIGYYAPGALPIRAKGDGKAPAPGWSGEYDWSGYVPFDQLPHVYNPPQGYIATANNKVTPDSYPHIISNSWAAPYRATRIVELIEAKPQLSPDDIAAMQADITSAQARQLLPYLLQAKTDDSKARAAIDFLQGWDGTMRGDSPQAAVYKAWYKQIPVHIFADELGDGLWQNYGREKDMISMIIPGLVAGSTNSWCDDVRTSQPEDCRTILGGALVAGLAEMSGYQGTDNFSAWRWDKVHHAQFPHNPFDNVGPLRPIFSRSIPNSGDDFTVNVAPIQFNNQYFQRHVPSYRQIVDLSDLGASRFNHTVGQSGYVLSGDYSNLLERWQRVEYLPMRFTQAAIDGAAAGRLTLEPAEGP